MIMVGYYTRFCRLTLQSVIAIFLFGSSAYCDSDVGTKHDFVLSKETPISHDKGGMQGLSSSKEPIDILSYGVHFRVPRNYIASTLENIRDHVMNFTLHTHYPEFTGATTDWHPGRLTKQDEYWIFGTSPSLIDIFTIGSEKDFDPEHDPTTIVFTAESHEPDHPWKYGLLKSLKRSWGLANIYFQRPIGDKPGYMVDCINPDNPHVTATWCDVYTRVSPHLVMLYRFHLELLPHWQEIDQNVRRLLQTFIIK